jgi:hypothetical protein
MESDNKTVRPAILNPCLRDCPDRVLGCHAQCERYTFYAEQRRKLLEARRAAGIAGSFHLDFCRQRNREF